MSECSLCLFVVVASSCIESECSVCVVVATPFLSTRNVNTGDASIMFNELLSKTYTACGCSVSEPLNFCSHYYGAEVNLGILLWRKKM